jgi:hypothetical protein
MTSLRPHNSQFLEEATRHRFVIRAVTADVVTPKRGLIRAFLVQPHCGSAFRHEFPGVSACACRFQFRALVWNCLLGH